MVLTTHKLMPTKQKLYNCYYSLSSSPFYNSALPSTASSSEVDPAMEEATQKQNGKQRPHLRSKIELVLVGLYPPLNKERAIKNAFVASNLKKAASVDSASDSEPELKIGNLFQQKLIIYR